MGANTFWHSLPLTVRTQIEALGAILGTGSVKQVNRAMFKDGKGNTEQVAVAILRRRVQDEALASLSALEASEDMAAVANRLGRMVYGEFDLFTEGEALLGFANTAIGKHELFRVVAVKHHSPRCLVEEIADGPTLAKVLNGISPSTPPLESHRPTLELLSMFHKAVFHAFCLDGLIHSDIHLGNIVQERVDGKLKLALFDVGQFEHASPADVKATPPLCCALTPPSAAFRPTLCVSDTLVSYNAVLGITLDSELDQRPFPVRSTPPCFAAPPLATLDFTRL